MISIFEQTKQETICLTICENAAEPLYWHILLNFIGQIVVCHHCPNFVYKQ